MTTDRRTPATAPSTLAWTRPLMAYLVTIAALAIAVTLGGPPERLLSLPLAVTLGTLLIPAAVATLHLAARVATGSVVVRALVGSAAWVGWYLIVALAVTAARTIGIWPEGFTALLAGLAAAGALYGVLAMAGRPTRAGRGTTILGIAVGAVIIVGCFVTAGWWGATG